MTSNPIINSVKKLYTNLNKYQKLLVLLMIVYTIVSFIRLGNVKSPKTFANLRDGEYVVYELLEDKTPSSIVFYAGNADVYLTVLLADEYDLASDTLPYDMTVTSDYDDVFTWNKVTINNEQKECKYIIVSSYWDDTVVGEIAFLDDNDEIIKTRLVEGNTLLNDEPNTIQIERDYLNSTYFDEIYFPRASYEIFNQKYIFEFTHPPLGKIIMWIPIAIFGMSPFAFRFMGNIAGILMILVIYKLGKELFKDDKYALFAATIIALDGMHFAQTRIATVDSFLVLFSLIAILFFVKYLHNDDKKTYKYLCIAGIAWGCAISVKWTAAYLGIGLAILFFLHYFIHQKIIIKKRLNYKPILMGVLCFVIIPVVVYAASYIPIYGNPNEVAPYDEFDEDGYKISKTASPSTLEGFLKYQYAMFQYHSNIGKNENYEPHPFSSAWYTWPVIYKPMWFYSQNYDDGLKSTIATMGNPAIWWLSIITAIYTLIYSIVKKDKTGLLIMILIASTWLPFAIISREMYIYHYFLASILMMLTIVFTMKKLCEWKSVLKISMPILTSIFLIIFIYFYPVYSGMIVSGKFIDATKWLGSWVY